jgi:hypothetical protein
MRYLRTVFDDDVVHIEPGHRHDTLTYLEVCLGYKGTLPHTGRAVETSYFKQEQSFQFHHVPIRDYIHFDFLLRVRILYIQDKKGISQHSCFSLNPRRHDYRMPTINWCGDSDAKRTAFVYVRQKPSDTNRDTRCRLT